MKTLLVMRHAKSSHDDPELSDHDRPLNNRGNNDAPRMAQWLAQQGLVPELILSSTAERAATTARLVREHLNPHPQLQLFSELYHASPGQYLEVIKYAPDGIDTLLVVGHNPGMEELVFQLAGNYHRMPTAAIAVFESNLEHWSQLSHRTSGMHLKYLQVPKDM